MRIRSRRPAQPGQGISSTAPLRRARSSSCSRRPVAVSRPAAFLDPPGAMSRFAPADLGELRDAIGEALAAEEPLELVAGGSKRALGRPLQLPRTLDLSRLSGIRDYQPSELVLTAAVAPPIAEIGAELAAAGQMLAFEPPDWGALLDLPASTAGRRTLGGVLACHLSGPRRVKAGAARDHFFRFRGGSGPGGIFKAGGQGLQKDTRK